MNIGIVTHAYYPYFGGVTEHVAGSAGALRRLGHRVTIITAESPGADESADVVRLGRQFIWRLHGASVNVTLDPRLRARLERIYRDLNLDVVHVHSPLTPMLPWTAVRAAVGAGLPVVGTFHAAARYNLGYHLARPILAPAFHRLSRRIAVSEPAREFVHRYFRGPIDIVPNGVDVDRFHPARGELTAHPPTVLFVGRLDPRKGVEYLIDAMPAVRERVSGARLVIIGDGPRRSDLEARAASLPAGTVELPGAVSPASLPARYRAAQVICAPATRNESFGIVLLEAMASGRPVVATHISGYRRVVEDGVTGRLVTPGDTNALAAAIGDVLTDPQARSRMGRAARRHAARFSWDVIGERLESIYDEVRGARGRTQAAGDQVVTATAVAGL